LRPPRAPGGVRVPAYADGVNDPEWPSRIGYPSAATHRSGSRRTRRRALYLLSRAVAPALDPACLRCDAGAGSRVSPLWRRRWAAYLLPWRRGWAAVPRSRPWPGARPGVRSRR